MNLLDKANKLRAKANDRAVTGQEKAILLAKAEELEKKHQEQYSSYPDHSSPTDVFGNPVKSKQEMNEKEKREYWARKARERHWVDEDLWLTDDDLEFNVYVNREGAHGRTGRPYSVGDPDYLYEERWKYDGQ